MTEASTARCLFKNLQIENFKTACFLRFWYNNINYDMRKILVAPPIIYLLFSLYSLLNLISLVSRYDEPRDAILVKIFQLAYFLIAVFFALLAYGIFKRKRWAYWANLLVFILSLFSLPLSLFSLASGIIVGLNKKEFKD